MVNMMRQQETADLQAAATNEQLRIARAKEDRETIAAQEERAHNIKIRPLQIGAAEFANLNAQLQNNREFITLVNNEIKNAKTPEAVIGAAAELKRRYPTQGQYIDRALAGMPTDPAKFEDWRMQSVFQSQDAKDQMAKTDLKQGEDGRYYMVEYGPRVKPSALEIPTYKLEEPQGAQGASARPMAAPANPMAAAPANAMAPAPNPMAAAPMPGPNTNPVGGAPLNIQSGNMFKPASMMTGPQMGGAQPNLASIVNEAMSSGQISGSNLQLMRDAAGPDKSAQLDQLLKTNNIQIVPDGMSSAMLRGGEAEDMLQQTQSREGYTATGQPFQGKPPMQGPYPGSALVPPSVLAAQAGAEARARGNVERSLRETPKEAAAKAAAIARANAAAETEKKANEKLPARRQVSTLLSKIRNAYNELDKAKAIPSETRGMVANAMDYFASTGLGREGQKMLGTKSSKYLSEIVNSRKLLATAIKNATGMSAQEMNSNVELQLTLDALTDPTQGIEAARSTINTLEELFGAGLTPVKRAQYTPEQMVAVRSIQGGPRGAGGTQTNPTMVMNAQQYARLPKGAWYIAENGYFAQKGSERD
jgi:hypothetical protein